MSDGAKREKIFAPWMILTIIAVIAIVVWVIVSSANDDQDRPSAEGQEIVQRTATADVAPLTVSQYQDKIKALMEQCVNGIAAFNEANTKAGAGDLGSGAQLQNSLAFALLPLEDCANGLSEGTAPPVFESVDRYLKLMGGELKMVVAQYRMGLKEGKAEYFNSAADHMDQAAEYFRIATDEVNKIPEDAIP